MSLWLVHSARYLACMRCTAKVSGCNVTQQIHCATVTVVVMKARDPLPCLVMEDSMEIYE